VLFAAALLASLAVKLWLAARQMRHVAAHRGAVPAAFAGTVSLEAHQKAADYTLAKARFGLLATAYGAASWWAGRLLGGLDALNGAVPRSGCSGFRQHGLPAHPTSRRSR
jgi:STE24 endopeptidase